CSASPGRCDPFLQNKLPIRAHDAGQSEESRKAAPCFGHSPLDGGGTPRPRADRGQRRPHVATAHRRVKRDGKRTTSKPSGDHLRASRLPPDHEGTVAPSSRGTDRPSGLTGLVQNGHAAMGPPTLSARGRPPQGPPAPRTGRRATPNEARARGNG